MDHWLADAAFRSLGTNYLLPDVIDTLLEFNFNHADLKYIERNAFNVKAIPATWSRLSGKLHQLLETSDHEGRFHSSFVLRQRLVHALIRSWTLNLDENDSLEIWRRINAEFDKASSYLETFKESKTERVVLKTPAGECHGLLRRPLQLGRENINLLIVFPGMDMTKEYFPSLIGSHTDYRDFSTLALDPPGHGYTYASGVKLDEQNMQAFTDSLFDWIEDDSAHEFTVDKIGVLGIGTSSNYALKLGQQKQSLSVVAGFEGGFLFGAKETLKDQSSARLHKLAKMMDCRIEEVPEKVFDLSLEKSNAKVEVPAIFSIGEHDDLLPKKQIEKLVNVFKSDYVVNFYEDEGHVLGKVINEALMTVLDHIEECFQGKTNNLKGFQRIERRS